MPGSRRAPTESIEGTIVFTDIVGFTEFTSTRGDAAALELLATQDRLVQAALPVGGVCRQGARRRLAAVVP